MKPCINCKTPISCDLLEKCHDHDTVIEGPPLKSYILTFGSGHHMGPNKYKLNRCYTVIRAEDPNDAIKQMHAKRERKWSHIYETEEEAGVEKYGLVCIPFHEVLKQEGDNI